MINYKKEIWEGWTVHHFIDFLQPQIDIIMCGNSYIKPFKNKAELKEYIINNQPYYKKPIPEVIKHFTRRYGLN